MRREWIGMLVRYSLTGGLNTLVHWCVFALVLLMDTPQAIANLVAFLVAVTVSFFVNARWTFKAQPSLRRYLTMVVAMGALSYFIGGIADILGLHPLVTLVTFSLISLVAGFLVARFVVFREVH